MATAATVAPLLLAKNSLDGIVKSCASELLFFESALDMLLIMEGGRSICISIALDDEHGDGAADGEDDTLDDELVLFV